jgi:bidirectional [NiFe] hydrogenase diaphorase subunit
MTQGRTGTELEEPPKKQVTVSINGNTYRADEGENLLVIAEREKIPIPHLCFEPSLDPYGACRLCMVGLVHRGKTSMATACTLRAKDGLTILTDTPEIVKYRSVLFELYLAQAPKSVVVKEMAARYGVTKTRFLRRVDTDDPLGGSCVLCGLCVRVCNEIMGAGAINFINRGPYTVVNTPYTEPSKDCLGCGACAAICPTHAVLLEDLNGERVLHSWSETKVPLSQCTSCGKYFAPAALERSELSRIEPLLRDDLAGLCPACRAKKLATNEILAATGGDLNHA